MTEYELYKLSEELDEDLNLFDFTPSEVEEMIKEKQSATKNFKDKYFEFYDDIKSMTKKRQDW